MAPAVQGSAQSDRRPLVTIPSLAEKKASETPIVMVTAYDYPSAQAVEAADIDLALAGEMRLASSLGFVFARECASCAGRDGHARSHRS